MPGFLEVIMNVVEDATNVSGEKECGPEGDTVDQNPNHSTEEEEEEEEKEKEEEGEEEEEEEEEAGEVPGGSPKI
nr:unnamed protein product [Spirometra erinaceieuropaei]